jgi:hypothetical protein
VSALLSLAALGWLAGSAAAQAVPDLSSAPVPSLCGHPAGNLVDGSLPGVPEHDGGVWLRATSSPHMVTQGVLRPGASADIAAVVSCNRGGVGWPDNIVVYDKRLRIIGTVELGKVTKGGRESVRRIWIERRTVFVQVWGIGRDGDAGCCGSASALVQLRWSRSRKRVTVAQTRIYDERASARRFLRAVQRGRRAAAKRYGSSSAVDALFAIRKRARLRLAGCAGILDDRWPGWVETDAFRVCFVTIDWKDSPYESGYGLFMDRVGWRGYRVGEALGIAG